MSNDSCIKDQIMNNPLGLELEDLAAYIVTRFSLHHHAKVDVLATIQVYFLVIAKTSQECRDRFLAKACERILKTDALFKEIA